MEGGAQADSRGMKMTRSAALIEARKRYSEARARALTAWFEYEKAEAAWAEYEKAEAEAHEAFKDWQKANRGEGKC